MFIAGMLSSLCALPLWMQATVAGLALFTFTVLINETKKYAIWSGLSTAAVVWALGTFVWPGQCLM